MVFPVTLLASIHAPIASATTIRYGLANVAKKNCTGDNATPFGELPSKRATETEQLERGYSKAPRIRRTRQLRNEMTSFEYPRSYANNFAPSSFDAARSNVQSGCSSAWAANAACTQSEKSADPLL